MICYLASLSGAPMLMLEHVHYPLGLHTVIIAWCPAVQPDWLLVRGKTRITYGSFLDASDLSARTPVWQSHGSQNELYFTWAPNATGILTFWKRRPPAGSPRACLCQCLLSFGDLNNSSRSDWSTRSQNPAHSPSTATKCFVLTPPPA